MLHTWGMAFRNSPRYRIVTVSLQINLCMLVTWDWSLSKCLIRKRWIWWRQKVGSFLLLEKQRPCLRLIQLQNGPKETCAIVVELHLEWWPDSIIVVHVVKCFVENAVRSSVPCPSLALKGKFVSVTHVLSNMDPKKRQVQGIIVIIKIKIKQRRKVMRTQIYLLNI